MWNFISGHSGAANFVEALEQRSMLSASTFYVQTNLVSDNALPGTRTDANLVNGWGIAHGATGPWWVSAAERGLSIAYDGTGAPAAPNVAIPPVPGETESNPTGVAANDSKAFTISAGGKSAPSLYVFVTENGTISGWNPNVDPNAILTVNNSRAGTVYKGGAIGVSHDAQFFFAADFHNARVDVFNRKFRHVALKRGAFTDTNLPAGYAPFNITNIGGQLYVTYALQDAAAHDDVAGPRHGFIDVFNTDGTLVKRFASRGSLDSHGAPCRPRITSASSATTSWSETSAMERSAPSTTRENSWASSPAPTAIRSRSTACGASASATAQPPAPPTPSSSPPAPKANRTASSAP